MIWVKISSCFHALNQTICGPLYILNVPKYCDLYCRYEKLLCLRPGKNLFKMGLSRGL